MNGVAALLCLALIVVIVVAVTAAFLLTSNKRKDYQVAVGPKTKRAAKEWKAWIGYILIALIFSIWSILAGLFFLAVVWIMRKDPQFDSVSTIGNTEKSTARRVYTWLFVSSLFTVPFFIILVFNSYSSSASANERVLTAFVPLLLHLPLLLGLTSKNIFVYRHTQQGILLVALRAGMAALALSIGSNPEDGWWLFLLGNGSLWLFGSIWGWVQINRGEYWWMKQEGDSISAKDETTKIPKIEPNEKLSPEQYLEYSKGFLKRQLKNSAKEYALEAFRRGIFDIRRQAVRVLDDLNEVEYF